MAQKRYSQFGALRQKLRRQGFKGPDKLATTLLDLKFRANGVIHSRQHYYNTSCEVVGMNYTQWIDTLVSKNWITKKPVKGISAIEHITYEPGAALIPYVNAEKDMREEMASMRDIFEQGLEIRSETKAQVDAVEAEVKSVKYELKETKRELQTVKSSVENLGKKMEYVYSIFDLGEPDPPDYDKLHSLESQITSKRKVKTRPSLKSVPN